MQNNRGNPVHVCTLDLYPLHMTSFQVLIKYLFIQFQFPRHENHQFF